MTFEAELPTAAVDSLLVQLSSSDRMVQASAYQELSSRVFDESSVRVDERFVGRLGDCIVGAEPHPYALRLLSKLIWLPDGLALFDIPHQRALAWETEASQVLLDALDCASPLDRWDGSVDKIALSFACGVCAIKSDRLVSLLGDLAVDSDVAVRDTAHISMAARAVLGDRSLRQPTEERLASLVADAIVRAELTDDALLAFMAPYSGEWGGGNKDYVWMTLLRCMVRRCSERKQAHDWAQRIASVAPRSVRRDTEDEVRRTSE